MWNLWRIKVLKNYSGIKVYAFNQLRTKVLKENFSRFKIYVFNLLSTKILKQKIFKE